MKIQLFIIGLFVGTFAEIDGLSEHEILERHHYRSRHQNKNHITVNTDSEELENSISSEDKVLIERAKGIGFQRSKRQGFAHNHSGRFSGSHTQTDGIGNIIHPWDPRFVHNCEYHNDCTTSTTTSSTTRTPPTTITPPTTKKPTVDPFMLFRPRTNADS